MKFNRSEIMKAAWAKFRRFNIDFATALRQAWYEAKKLVLRFNVYGESLFGGKELLLSGGTDEQVRDCKYYNQYRYDNIIVTVAA